MCCSPQGHKESDTTERLSSNSTWDTVVKQLLAQAVMGWKRQVQLRTVGGATGGTAPVSKEIK